MGSNSTADTDDEEENFVVDAGAPFRVLVLVVFAVPFLKEEVKDEILVTVLLIFVVTANRQKERITTKNTQSEERTIFSIRPFCTSYHVGGCTFHRCLGDAAGIRSKGRYWAAV
jgi:hypothetical protein